MTTTSESRDPERTWRRLRENPDYVADWRASAGPTAREAPPLAFRRQTEADLEAARWKLLAWENPHRPQWAELFRADVAMVEARVAAPGPSGKYSWRRLVLSAGATYTGLRLPGRRRRVPRNRSPGHAEDAGWEGPRLPHSLGWVLQKICGRVHAQAGAAGPSRSGFGPARP